MLDLRPNCELCDTDPPPETVNARIGSDECTFCADGVDRILRDVCPNCGGGFAPRPIRPRQSWRPNAGLAHDRPHARRVKSAYTIEEIEAFAARLHAMPPNAR